MKGEKYMKRKIRMYLYLLAGAVFATAPKVRAQSVSNTHDAAKMNQITVAETGTGTLTPTLYYQVLHKSYSKSASSKNKMSFRTLAGINLYNQVDEAEALDSALTQRARVEALNIADRSGGALDVAWLAESDKINAKMADFERNIQRILQVGGTANNQTHWKEHYNLYRCAVKATQDAYMPNSQRKKQYLRIYADVARKNEALTLYLVRLSKARNVTELLSATGERTDRKAQIAVSAMNRWRDAGWNTVSKGRNNTQPYQ